MWSHLVSDVSFAELHAFARSLGVPPRAFERDHYDLPGEWYADAVRAGAVEVGGKELLRRLTEAGLRRRKSNGPQQAGADRPRRDGPEPRGEGPAGGGGA
jgi:Protein of unknown function (DUF4031)